MTETKLKRHPLSKDYTDISGPAWESFVADLLTYGVIDGRKITLYEDQVIDGWQLYRGCLEAKIDPLPIEELVLQDNMTPEAWVRIKQDNRRHETAEDKAKRVAARRERVVAGRKEGKSQRTLAEEEGVSRAQIREDLELSGGQSCPPDAEDDDNSDDDSGGQGGTPDEDESDETDENAPPDEGEELHPADKPPKVTGMDGKTYPAGKTKILCERCARVGAVKNCQMCKEARATAPKKPRGKKKDKPDNGDGPVDHFGTPIPKRCRDTFCDPWIQKTFDKLCIIAEEFRAERMSDGMNKRKKHYPFFNAKDFIDGVGMIDSTLDLLIDHLKDYRPAAVCPSCDGKGCTDCNLSGLVYRELYGKLKGGKK